MKIDGVFSGGGVKAYAFIGALEEIEKKGYTFVRVAGTSAGAILAGFIAAGYSSREIRQMFEDIKLQEFMDPTVGGKLLPFLKWFLLYFSMGLYKGDAFESWLYAKFAERGIYTFRDLPSGSLKVVASDLTLGRIVVIPDDLKRLYNIDSTKFPVSTAIRMSAGLPYFFVPKKISNQHGKSIIVDGALLSNFPLWVLEGEREARTRPVMGMQLSEAIGRIPSKEIKNAISLFQSVFTTMRKAHDARYISKTQANDIIFIPVKEIDTTDFNLSDEKKQELIDQGRKYAKKFLKRWS